MTESIVILLGNQNLPSGELKDAAKLRCDRAIALLNELPELRILPTGAFGPHFNTGPKPHGEYLTNYLVEHGVPRDRILPYTNSSNTLEDALVARQRLYDLGLLEKGRVYVVTNIFHRPRAEYIFTRLFPEIELIFVEAADPSNPEECRRFRQHEAKSLRNTIRDWTNVPLYHGQPFPDAVYENASAEQKHYDNLSVYAITGILVAFAFPLSSFDELTRLNLVHLSLVATSIVILFLCALYVRFADFAAEARLVMRWLEVAFDHRGFSATYRRAKVFGFSIGIKEAICLLVVAFVITLMTLVFLI